MRSATRCNWPVPGYLNSLCDSLGTAFRSGRGRTTLRIDLAPLSPSPEDARSIGLIVVELVTNAMRHAFPSDYDGTVHVTGAADPAGYRIRIQDNGRGLPATFTIDGRGKGLGLRLINLLTKQLRGQLTHEFLDGACFTLTLPAPRHGTDAGN